MILVSEQIIKNKWRIFLLLSTIIGASSFTFSNKNNDILTKHKEKNIKTNNMKKILVIGIDPKTIDYSNPDLVPGLTVGKIEAGMKVEKEKLQGLGFATEFFLFGLTETETSKLVTHLKKYKYDGIVIGAGIRVPQNTFTLFEKTINAVHENAPSSKIMFNTLPTNTSEAIRRWL